MKPTIIPASTRQLLPAIVLKLALTGCFLGAAFVTLAQEQGSFELRLKEIKEQLSFLADSIVPGLNQEANLSVSGITIQSFLRTVAESHNLNIQVDPSLDILITSNFSSVRVQDLIYFVCDQYRLDIKFTGNILSFIRHVPPKAVPIPVARKKLMIRYDSALHRLSLDLNGDSLRAVVKEITRISHRNVLASGGMELDAKMLSGYIADLPLESALDKIAYINGLRLNTTKDGVFIFEGISVSPVLAQPMQGNFNRNLSVRGLGQGDITIKDSLVNLDVANFPIIDIIGQTSTQLGVNYILFADVAGNTTARVKNVRYDDLLSFLFQGTAYTYKNRDGVYLIGARNSEGFRSTELVKLDFRTIDGIDKEIPTDLSKEMEIKIYKELNALIITGNKNKIDDIVGFLKLIDQPIPNILIEVIVADARKGFSLQTGLKAFLADSVPQTGGQVFPGIDVTVGTPSINKFLQNLDSKGVVNLGRVSPNFYITLEALEKNNNIQIRSTPKLSTINGSKATLTIGESVYYVEQTQNITGGVNPITTTAQRFNKVEANLAITISPLVSGNEHITLDITAEFSDFIQPTIQNAPPGNATRKFESKIRVKNEEMIILGGLEELTRSEVGSGTPILSRIPVLRWLFSSRTKDNSDNRLIVFIKPTLVY